jgi:hypothetical protein
MPENSGMLHHRGRILSSEYLGEVLVFCAILWRSLKQMFYTGHEGGRARLKSSNFRWTCGPSAQVKNYRP